MGVYTVCTFIHIFHYFFYIISLRLVPIQLLLAATPSELAVISYKHPTDGVDFMELPDSCRSLVPATGSQEKSSGSVSMLTSPMKNHQKTRLTHGFRVFFVCPSNSNQVVTPSTPLILTNSPRTRRSSLLVTHAARWQSNGYFPRSNGAVNGRLLRKEIGGWGMGMTILSKLVAAIHPTTPHCRSTRPSETENSALRACHFCGALNSDA